MKNEFHTNFRDENYILAQYKNAYMNTTVGSQIVAQTQIEQDMGPINPIQ